MVGNIAKYLTNKLIADRPEYFKGFMDIKKAKDVKKHTEKLTEYAEAYGLCHDIGKFIYADNPYMFARVLTEDELDVVRQHPEEGFSIFSHKDNSSYDGYADIILGHHKYYDNSGGYPDTFDISKSKYKAMIDIIKIADTIDAATDNIGKVYAKAKEFKEVCLEIQEGAGCEYSPVLAGLLNDDKVISDLNFILDTKRKEAYFTAYEHAWS